MIERAAPNQSLVEVRAGIREGIDDVVAMTEVVLNLGPSSAQRRRHRDPLLPQASLPQVTPS